MQKRVALINDLSGYGKCSINTQIPIIAAFGDTASCCLTSYLSNHTAYRDKVKIDLNEELPKVLKMWEELNFKFDGVITGYVGNAANILNIREYLADQKLENDNMFIMVDPVFADNGKMYCEMTDEHVTNFKKLMEISDITTPNITEACMLTGVDYEVLRIKCGLLNYEGNEQAQLEKLSKKVIEACKEVLEKIIFKKNQITIITGIELYNSIVTIMDVFEGDKGVRQTTCNFAKKLDPRPGAGDLFDALFMETKLFGYGLVDCLNITSGFISNALRFSIDKKYPYEEGIIYEPILFNNMNVIMQNTKRRDEVQNNNGQTDQSPNPNNGAIPPNAPTNI